MRRVCWRPGGRLAILEPATLGPAAARFTAGWRTSHTSCRGSCRSMHLAVTRRARTPTRPAFGRTRSRPRDASSWPSSGGAGSPTSPQSRSPSPASISYTARRAQHRTPPSGPVYCSKLPDVFRFRRLPTRTSPRVVPRHLVARRRPAVDHLFTLVLIIAVLIPALGCFQNWFAARGRAAASAGAAASRTTTVRVRRSRASIVAAPKPPDRAEPSDQDRDGAVRASVPTARQNRRRTHARQLARSASKSAAAQSRARSGTDARSGQPGSRRRTAAATHRTAIRLAVDAAAATPPPQNTHSNGANGTSRDAGGSLGDALRNLQRYVPRGAFDNPRRGRRQFGPEIQFDTKGVGVRAVDSPLHRAGQAQLVRPVRGDVDAAGTSSSRSTCTRTARSPISASSGPCPIDAFNNAAFGALSGSNPTTPLPPEYPSDKAFFTVTFFYNESPAVTRRPSSSAC